MTGTARKVRGGRIDIWTAVTIMGFAVVIVLLIIPLFNIFKSSVRSAP